MSATILEGKAEADVVLAELRHEVERLGRSPRLAIVHFDPSETPSPFVRQKVRASEQAGVEARLYPLARDASAAVISQALNQIAHEAHADGMIVQLPLPAHLDQNRYGLLRIIPREKDVDCLGEEWLGRLQTGRTRIQLARGSAEILPPVVASIERILQRERVDVRGKRVAVVGWGDLVGKPCAAWFLRQGATVTVATETEPDLASITQQAEILVSGVGKPNIITGNMIKQNAIVFDAGTSEVNGALRGDVDAESLKEKAAFLTPVPGGLGPLAVAMLLRNVVAVALAQRGPVKNA